MAENTFNSLNQAFQVRLPLFGSKINLAAVLSHAAQNCDDGRSTLGGLSHGSTTHRDHVVSCANGLPEVSDSLLTPRSRRQRDVVVSTSDVDVAHTSTSVGRCRCCADVDVRT